MSAEKKVQIKLGKVQERRDADAGKIRKIFFKTDEIYKFEEIWRLLYEKRIRAYHS